MADLEKRKENFSRNNRFRTLHTDVRVGAYRNNLTGVVSITINSDPADGEDVYKLTLSPEDVKKLAWIWKEACK